MKTKESLRQKTGLKVAVVLVAVMIVASGCLTGVDADEVRDGSLSAMEDVETYDYEMDMDMEMGAGDTPGSISMSMETNGSVDKAERRMSAHSTINSFGIEFGQEAYVLDDTMYMTMGMGQMGMGGQDTPQWFKIQNDSMVSSTWESSNYADQYRDILEISEVEYEQDESVNGENAYLLTLSPDTQQYNQLVREQMAGMSGMQGNEGMGEFLNEDGIEIQNVSMRYWISEETGYILRTQSNTTMTMEFGFGEESGEQFEGSPFGGSPEEMTVEMNADVRLFDHGEEVDIEIPEGTEDAQEFEALLEGEAVSSQTTVSKSGREIDGGILDRIEIRNSEETDSGVSPVATVYFSDSVKGDVVIEATNSGDYSEVSAQQTIDNVSTTLDPEGDEIVIAVDNGTGMEVVHREPYTP